MLRRISAILFLLSFTMWARPAFPQTTVDVGRFYDELAPYGEWISTPEYGWVWSPYDMEAGWRPYTNGHWEYTDYGWTWVSDLDWGWATFHYGRWYFDDMYGWVWIPGTVWGPAWVAWRHGDGYIGWAPLPPGVIWQAGLGLSWGDLDFGVALGWHDWNFCNDRYFLDRHLRKHLLGPAHNLTLMERTRNITDYQFMHDHVFNRGLSVERAEQMTHHKIQHYMVQNFSEREKRHVGRIVGHELRMFRPAIAERHVERTPPPPQAGRRFDLQSREKKLQAYQARQREELRRSQEERLKKAEPGQSRQEMRRRQEQETTELRDHQRRESSALDNRARRAQEPAAPPREPQRQEQRQGHGRGRH